VDLLLLEDELQTNWPTRERVRFCNFVNLFDRLFDLDMESSLANSAQFGVLDRLIRRCPSEVWSLIFGNIPFVQVLLCARVSSYWRKSVYCSVTKFEGTLSWHQLHLTDAILQRFTSLRTLVVYSNPDITDAGMKSLVNLTDLELRNNELITGESLSRLLHLTSLNISSRSAIDNNGLSRLTNLSTLSIANNDNFTDAGLMSLAKLTTLKLYNTKNIGDLSLKALPNLTCLTYYATTLVTDAGLKCLTKLEELNGRRLEPTK
jgi:hypothetical protein